MSIERRARPHHPSLLCLLRSETALHLLAASLQPYSALFSTEKDPVKFPVDGALKNLWELFLRVQGLKDIQVAELTDCRDLQVR